MAYIMPVVFFAFIALMYILFYLHDKSIITGAGYETAVVGCQKLKWNDENIEEQLKQLFRERTVGKLIFFSKADMKLVIEGEMVTVKASAEKKRMKIYTEQKCRMTRPETFIRNVRRVHGN